jgi:AcrR family transcriptional regulator
MAVAQVAPKLLDATVAVLGEVGWDGLSLERVAERAGVSRVTLWRQGVTKDSLVEALLERLAADYRDAMWPVLTADATGRERLGRALEALCDVADRHLELLLISDEVFHRAPANFLEPLVRALRDGYADGSLQRLGSAEDAADAIFNTVCWGYVHLRARHKWSVSRTRSSILGLVAEGYAATDSADSVSRSKM